VGTFESGLLMAVDLDEELEEATLSYSVKFEKGYDWFDFLSSCLH
jgi:hypothetical protein